MAKITKNTNDEQIRNLLNKVHLAGILAELEYNVGQGSDGVKYLSIKGAVQCSEDDPAYTAYFSSFIKEKKKDGGDSKLYKSAQDWLKTVTPMTKSKKDASLVDLQGSLTANNYVASDGTFKETFVNNIQFFNKFEDFAYDIDIEGYIKNIVDEMDEDENETGRKKVSLISKDIFNNALKFEKDRILIAGPEIAEAFDSAEYEIGRTVSVCCSRTKVESNAKAQRNGFGKQPVTAGKSEMFWEIIGGDEALDEDDKDALTTAQIKMLLNEMDARNEQKISEGYKGSKGSSGGVKNRTGLGSSSKKSNNEDFEEIDNDDDMPF